MMQLRLRALALVQLASATGLQAQYPVARIDSIFAPWNQPDSPGCLTGVRLRAAEPLIRAYGMANLESDTPLTPESISESGSVAKQFTAASIGLLVLRGQLSLDDEIHKYLPEVPDFGHPIKLRNLLNHTSGLRDQWALLGIIGWPPGTEVHTLDQILYLVSRQRRLNFEPETEYLYSNTGYALAAIIIQRVTGKSLAEFSRDELFRPLGMTETAWRDDYRRVVPKRATAYSHGPNGAGWLQDMPFTMVYGNGGLLSSMRDLLIWNDALTTGKVPGGPALVRLLEERARLADGTTISYALGLTHADYRGIHEISHGGSTAGYRTYLARWPDRGLSVAVFCNAGSADPARYARGIADVVLGLGPPTYTGPKPVAVTPGELAAVAGAYRDTTTDQAMTFTVADGRLTVSTFGRATPLTPLGGGRFWSEAAGEFQFEAGSPSTRVTQRSEGRHEFERDARFDPASVRPGDYTGTYKSEELDVRYEVRIHDGRLEVKNGHRAAYPLVPIYPDGFRGGPATFRFTRDADGRILGFRIFAGRARDVRFERTR
jgi:CubicO group peptidase (beta-lactamase class C family)